MPRSAVADEVEGLVATEFCQQDPVRLHAQAGFEAVLGTQLAKPLASLGVKQMHHIGLPDEQFACILDGDQPLIRGNVLHQRFHERRLAAAGGAGDHDILAVMHGLPEEGSVLSRFAQVQQLRIVRAEPRCVGCQAIEKTVVGVLLQTARFPRGQANGDGDRTGLHGGRHHELGPLPGWKGQGDHGFRGRDALAGIAFVHHRGAEMPRTLVAQPLHRHPVPAAVRFQIHATRTVDADLRHVGSAECVGDAEHLILVLQETGGESFRRNSAIERRAHGCSTPAKSISREA